MDWWESAPLAPATGGGNWWDTAPLASPQKTAAAAPDVGRGTAALEGYLSGASANFRDEIYGASKASGLPDWMGGFRAPVGAARLLLADKDSDVNRNYEQARDEKRDLAKTAAEQYPGTTMAGNVAGAIAAPGSSFLRAATLPARMVRGAAVGGAYGALAGAGEGENPADRATRAGTGGLIGLGAGAVLPPVAEGIIQAGRGAAYPLTTMFRGAVNPEAEAGRRVVQSLDRDIRTDPNAVNRLTPAEFAGNSGANGPATLMDIGGETTRALARSAANTSPEGRGALTTAINDRFEGQSGRVSDWLNGAFNFPNAAAQEQALAQTARGANQAAYRRAYDAGASGVWSPTLERLSSSGAVSEAMQRAAKNAGDEAVVSGYGAMSPRVTFTPDGRMQFNRAPNGMPTYPDLQFWDLTRRELSDAARRAGQGTSEARRLNAFATAMNTELDRMVPSYQQARQTAAHFFGADNALEAGQTFVGASQRFGIREAQQAIARMTPTERQLFQDGYVSRYVEKLNATGDRRNVLNQVAQSPAARQELQIALGPQRAAELEARLRIEGIMDMARTTVTGNSTTTRQLVEMGLAGGAGGYGYLTGDVGNAATVLGAVLASRGQARINNNVSRHVADLLTSNDPRRLMQGIQLVARNNRLMDNLRAFDRRIAAVGGQQGANVPGLQAPGMSRADENQP